MVKYMVKPLWSLNYGSEKIPLAKDTQVRTPEKDDVK